MATDDTEPAAEGEREPHAVGAAGADPPASGTRRHRLVTVVLLAVGLVIVLALGATALLRSRAAPTPTQTPTAVAQTAPAPVAAAQATPTAAAAGTPAATLAAVPTPAGPPGTRDTPTPDPTVTAAVSAAYDRYWQVRSEALLNLDPSQLSSVMDGNELDATIAQISNLQTEGQAIYTDVQHTYQISQVGPAAANVDDHYIDNSYFVRPGTTDRIEGAASPPGAGQTVATLFVMAETDGVWKVVESAPEQ